MMESQQKMLGALLLGFVLGIFAAWFWFRSPPFHPVDLLQLEDMGHLTTLKFNYTQNFKLTKERDLRWLPKFGGVTVVLFARGDCLIASDMRVAKYESINAKRRTASLLLPMPGPISARVNHATAEEGGSQLLAISSHGIEPLVPGEAPRKEAVDLAFATAQKDIERACKDGHLIVAARRNSEEALRGVFQSVGWKVDLLWK